MIPLDHPPLALDDVRKNFGARTALAGLDLVLRPGQVYALLGPNGAGKTTTINLVLGFLKADGGRVLVGGIDAAQDPIGARTHVAYIPEQVALYPHLSGLANLRYFTTLAGLSLDTVELARLLLDAGLAAEAHDRRGGTYSKGMRQKVAIAIAMARQARLLLLDEPTSGLDPAASAEFVTMIRRAAATGTTVLMATHDLAQLADIADRVGILIGGRLADELDPSALDTAALQRHYIGSVAL